MMIDNEWLNQLKAGDEIFVSSGWGSGVDLHKVSRITKAQIFIRLSDRYEKAFRKKDGRGVGDGTYHRQRLVEATEELRKKYEIARLTSKARSLRESMVIPTDKPLLIELISTLEKFQPAKQDAPEREEKR